MKLIYIAGPYSAPTAWQRECNIRAAEAQCLKLWRVGVPSVCVHTMSRYFYEDVSEETAIVIDNAILMRCDAILLCPGWQDSKGTRDEIDLANAMRKRVFRPDEVADCIEWATDDEGE